MKYSRNGCCFDHSALQLSNFCLTEPELSQTTAPDNRDSMKKITLGNLQTNTSNLQTKPKRFFYTNISNLQTNTRKTEKKQKENMGRRKRSFLQSLNSLHHYNIFRQNPSITSLGYQFYTSKCYMYTLNISILVSDFFII